jgi:glycosyltransferase involved in cell wall biosynthesis
VNASAALELIHQRVCQCPGVVVLMRPSIEVAVSAVSGVVEGSSIHGPPRVYIVDFKRQHLLFILAELKRMSLADEVTLYHGSLTQFFRDLPLRADLICVDPADLDLLAGGLRFMIHAGTTILSLDGASGSSDQMTANGLANSGVLELDAAGPGGTAYLATERCQGAGFVPDAHFRMVLRNRLHERYLLGEAGERATHTAVADLTEDIRREFSREFPAASGSGAWPYIAPESAGLPLTLPSGKPWPKISIVTATRNQGKYIEETILSVLNQGYPNVEHIVIDGASTDGTPSVLERYRDKLGLVISEPDEGQSNAINKGMSRATGEILTWLNSDDMLAPGALAAVALAFDLNRADMIAGVCRLYQDGRLLAQHLTACANGPLPLDNLLDLDHGWNAGQFFHQPEVMFTRELWLRAGGHLDEQLYFSMDYELWLRFARAGAHLHVIGRPLAWFRVHPEQKTYAMSSFLPELTACRDNFVRKNGQPTRPAPLGPSGREKLRITLLNDHGGFYGAGIAHVRLARALARAGHDINLVSMLDGPARRGSTEHTSQSVLDRVSASSPDLVIVSNLHNSDADPLLLHLLSEKFSTVIVMHDFWILTGRCGYTAACEKYLTGCDDHCPTPNEYPALPPAEIAEAWLKKRLLLGADARPALLANSEWTAAFARRALESAFNSSQTAPSIEVFRLSFPLDVFRPRNRQACREQLGLPLDRFIVLLPASLDDPRKGARALLDALARLELPGLLVVTTGWPSANPDGPMEVMQLGYINDPHKVALLNSAADVVVAPSSAETFGQIFIEAIACGTPVAGYPLAAVPEAIREGVTGVLATNNEPASLAAATHYLYTHPELRNDLARWGRIYVENEWSEFSAYRSFFLALYAFGLDKKFNLRRTIGFLPHLPAVPPLEIVGQNSARWQPHRGFSGIEHSADHNLAEYRWAFGPVALAEIVVDSPGRYSILIAYRNPHEGQRLKLRFNGAILGTYELPNTGWDSTRVLVQDVRFDCETNLIHFELSQWYPVEVDVRPLAIIITEMLVEKVGEWDQNAAEPTSHQALSAVWGETESLQLRIKELDLKISAKT